MDDCPLFRCDTESVARSGRDSARGFNIGVISDTHGLLRPEALAALAGSDLLVHAGDIGSSSILDRLRAVAPIHAVRGNVDSAPWAASLPSTDLVEAGGVTLLVLHDLGTLDLDPAAAGVAAVISGHSHVPTVEIRRGVLFVNPGSAGPRRFRLPVSVARIAVDDGRLRAEIVSIEP